jgi:hypothetical protein
MGAAQLSTLPPRWTQLRPHPAGEAYSNSPHRFNTVAAGRRSGKTERAKRKLVRKLLSAKTTWEPRFFAGAPTRDQAKRIFWDDLKLLVPRYLMAERPSESELKIRLVTGGELFVVGLDVPERIEGSPWVFTVDGKTPVTFVEGKKRLDKASGTSGWTLHDLRRTARSLLSRAGVSADTAERCLGHVIGGVRGVL